MMRVRAAAAHRSLMLGDTKTLNPVLFITTFSSTLRINDAVLVLAKVRWAAGAAVVRSTHRGARAGCRWEKWNISSVTLQ